MTMKGESSVVDTMGQHMLSERLLGVHNQRSSIGEIIT